MKWLRNSKGLTLFEVLAVVVILAIVSMLSISIVTSATKQQIEQSAHNRDIKDLSFALKVITKDFRKSDNLTTDSDDTTDPPTELHTLLLGDEIVSTYRLENNQIIRNSNGSDEILAYKISKFTISGGAIEIISEDGQRATTDITQRRGK
ncbi:PulJ/GspJ family protein [Lysinibacillus pakistanensis]|uniref:Prepilin-type N-terminal cleavage/methylation domain-containing protein n=1 Tax=Lysinibacillus pakistanensis TaxID=759811 RepID=A0AAX3X2D1_9BACI|nr:prepilin-type N-terminal cleavage/methylation domain-containing protein [Lysinibacillus pakistanensis]MDM5232359.1 prepilin-type N-terminal cleavage/methylation domain-containing protein [Lysinibacillus pakistanensis]WHY47873.1 prepilin-type N-terminal cleavage/methylation domain-containing protein [Lysinibacillus pakistanensis]WHY52885.1 prepilin-type N-terminal cleavage/methylation domain-containing protein [Lysinibacillus pakistanensis]